MPNNQNGGQNQRNTQIAIGVAVIVVVGLLAWWLFSKPAVDTASMATSTTQGTDSTAIAASDTTDLSAVEGAMVTTDASMTTATNETVSVSDQPAGDSVRISSVTLSKAGWVAVRDSLRIHGAAWLTAGTHENVSVPLLRNTTSGDKYSVVLYVDNGNKQFDMHADSLISGMSGTFTATNGD